MLRIKRVLFTVTFLTLFTFALNACDNAPGGYSRPNPTWNYDRTQSPAEQAPSSTVPETQTTPESQSQTQFQRTPKATSEAVKVGILLPLSGRHKTLGDAMLKAAQIAIFDIGFENFELIPQDTKGTPEGARDAARAAIHQDAELILGPLFAESVKAARPVTNASRINMIAFSTDWTLAGGNTFIMGFLPFDQIERLTQYLASKSLRRVGVFAPDTAYGQAVSNAFDRLGPQNQIQTVSKTLFPSRTTNLAPVLRDFTRYEERQATAQRTGTDMTNIRPFDAVLMPVGGGQAETIANLLSHYDLPPRAVRRLGTGLFDDPSLAAESNLNGAWFAAPSPNLRRRFEQKYIATYGTSAPRLSSLAYDATALAAVLAKRGMQNNGRPDFDRNAIINPNGFSGIDGIFRFRKDGTAERGLAILEFQRGQAVVIDPAPKTFQQTTQYR